MAKRRPKRNLLEEFEPLERVVLGHRVTKPTSDLLKRVAKERGWRIDYTLEVAIQLLEKASV